MSNIATKSLGALNDEIVASPLDNFGVAGIIITGTWVGTISFYGSLDGVNYVPIQVQNLTTNAPVFSTIVNGQFVTSTSGMKAVKAIMSAYTSGTADVTIQAQAGPGMPAPALSVLETGNTTASPLIASTTWRGKWFRWQGNFLKFGISVSADVSGQLWIDFSESAAPVDGDDTGVSMSLFYNYDPATDPVFREHVPVQSTWVRARFTNGVAAQSRFMVNAILLNSDPGHVALQLRTVPVRAQLAGITRSIPAIMNAAGTGLQELPVASDGNPKSYISHIEDDLLIEPLSGVLATQTVVGIAPTLLDASPVSSRRVISVTNEGPGRIAVGHVPGMTFDASSIRVNVGSTKTFGIDATVPVYAITEDLGGAQTLFNRTASTLTGTAASPTNAQLTDNIYATISAAAQTIVTSAYTAGTANPLVSVRMGIEGNKQSGTTETATYVDTQIGAADNVGTVSSATVTAVTGHFYLAAISRREDTATVTSVSGLGLTWTLVATSVNGADGAVDVWYAIGTVTGNGVVTATFSANAIHSHIAVSRFTNVNSVTPIQAFATSIGGNDTPTVGALASTNKGVSYLAAAGKNRTFTAGSGYTLVSNQLTADGGNSDSLGAEYKLLTVTGTDTPSLTLSGNANWAAVGLTLNPADAVNPVVTLSYRLSGVPGATTGNVTFSSASDVASYINITPDRAWVVADVPNIEITATGLTISAATARIDQVFLEIVDTTGSTSRVSVWQGGKAVT